MALHVNYALDPHARAYTTRTVVTFVVWYKMDAVSDRRRRLTCTGVHSNGRLGGRTLAVKYGGKIAAGFRTENFSPRHGFQLSGSPLIASPHTLNDVLRGHD